jgi:peroxiredoxin Q/BCP
MDYIPSFECASTAGHPFVSSDIKKPYVLFFYPRNNTPGCTQENIEFTKFYDQFLALGWDVFGISRDTLGSHQRFKKKINAPYDLLADPEETVCNLFDVMKHKTMYGKPVRGIERSTFLIHPDGRILYSWRKVQVDGHVEEVLAKIHHLDLS